VKEVEMRINDRISLVGSGDIGGLSLSHPLDCNIYLINGSNELALVDAGTGLSLDEVVANISIDGYDPDRLRFLLLTHGHYDHSGGSKALRDRFSLTVVGSPLTRQWLESADAVGIGLQPAQSAGLYPAEVSITACPVEQTVWDGDILQVGDLSIQVVETPGHAGGHLSYHLLDEQALFSGDCIFAGGKIILQNLPDCSLSEYTASLRKLATIPVEMLLPSHGLFAVRRGHRHIARANQQLDNLQVPLKAELD
jgi:glyoxylase-like metal-dependent hydrolase (beta-lactamase superfamily II)